MIRCSIKYDKDGRLELLASGHAGGNKTVAGYDLICAGFTTLIKNFAMSVTALTGAREEIIADEKGILHYRWHADWEARGSGRFTLLVLLRSVQIGLENLALNYPDHISLEFQLTELFNRAEVPVSQPIETKAPEEIMDELPKEALEQDVSTE